MPLNLDDTIAAIASPPGPAERGIVRISGLATASVVGSLFRSTEGNSRWREMRRPARTEGSLDVSGLSVPLPASLMFWPTNRSYTGQPMAELHTIGSPPLLDAVLDHVFRCGARAAGRGEFTMRAFLGGRIDLVQAEAVLGVIDATDHEDLLRALGQLGGGVTERFVAIRAELTALLGDLEAGLDFVEEDIEFIGTSEICNRLQQCAETLHSLSETSENRLPSGYRRRIVLAGLPNAGKSTLFNRLLGRQQAIVSPTAGTTRDYLSSVMQFGSIEVELIDTAGREDTTEFVLRQAQILGTDQIQSGDLIVWCTSAVLSAADTAEDRRLRNELSQAGHTILHTILQCDRRTPSDSEQQSGDPDDHAVCLSALTGDGMDAFVEAVVRAITDSRHSRSEIVFTTAARCRESIRRCALCVESARSAAESELGDEVVAVELRSALQEIAVILGEVYTDDILDHIFSSFCIGK